MDALEKDPVQGLRKYTADNLLDLMADLVKELESNSEAGESNN